MKSQKIADELVTIKKEDLDELLQVLYWYNAQDETHYGSKWEHPNDRFLRTARRGVAILEKFEITPVNNFKIK